MPYNPMRITKPNWGPLAHGGKANLLTPGCGGQCSVYCRASSKESKQLVFKRHKLAASFQGKVFKDRVKKRGYGP